MVVTPLLGPGIHTWCCCCSCFPRAARPWVSIHNSIQPHAPGLLLGALEPAGRPPPEATRYPGPAGCMAMHWRAPRIRRSQMRRRYDHEGAHRPVQRPPWVIRRASCGVAVRPRCDAGPDRNRAPGPGRARATPCGPRPLTGLGKGLRSTARAPSGKPWPEGARGCTCRSGGAPGFASAQPGGEHTRGWPRWSTSWRRAGCAGGVLAAPALVGGVLYEAQENTPGIKPE